MTGLSEHVLRNISDGEQIKLRIGDADIGAFAEATLEKYGPRADLRALELSEHFRRAGDRHNAMAWLEITDKIREMQNINGISRCGG